MSLEKLAYQVASVFYLLSDVIRTMQGREVSEWIHLSHERVREEFRILSRKLEENHLEDVSAI